MTTDMEFVGIAIAGLLVWFGLLVYFYQQGRRDAREAEIARRVVAEHWRAVALWDAAGAPPDRRASEAVEPATSDEVAVLIRRK